MRRGRVGVRQEHRSQLINLQRITAESIEPKSHSNESSTKALPLSMESEKFYLKWVSGAY